MTTALYRRYRPDTFQEVIGQEHVTAPLMAALRGDRVTHAYLFSGPRGCGKTTSARILARCLNCERFPSDTPCGTCPSCRDLATGGPGSLDVVEIDAASHNGVDDARDLRERASFAPARDRYKIFILDEAHMVTPQGFNALLKLVEEPPAHVKFIFATTEPEKVIGTIRSRTHHYPFRLVPPDTLEDYLGHLCGAEGVVVGPGVFPLVVRAGGGSVRDTLSVMDQLIGGAVDGEVDYVRAVSLLGYTDTTMLDQCLDAIAAADGAGVFRVVERVVSSGHDPRRFVEDLLQRLRDLLVIALAGAQAGPALGSLPADQLARMEVQARTVGAAGLSRAADMTAQALGQMVGATSPRLQLELLMARLLVPVQRRGVGEPATSSEAGASTGSGYAPDGATSVPGRGRALAAQIAQRSAGAGGTTPPGEQVAAGGAGARPDRRGRPAVSPQAPGAATAQPAGAGAGPSESTPSGRGPAAPAPAVQGSAASGSSVPGPAASSPGPAVSAPSGVEADWGDAPDGPAPGTPGPAAPDTQRREGPPAGGAAEAEMIRTRWEEVLEAAKRSRRATWALVGPNSQPGAISGGVFEVLFTAQGLVNAFENGGHGPILAAALHQALGLDLEVHAVLAGPGGGPAGPGGPGPGGRPGGAGPGGPGPDGRPGGAGPAGGPVAAGDAPEPFEAAAAPGLDGAPGPGYETAPGRLGGLTPSPPASRAESDAPMPAPPEETVDDDDDGWGEVAIPGRRRALAAQDPDPAPTSSAGPASPGAAAPDVSPASGAVLDGSPGGAASPGSPGSAQTAPSAVGQEPRAPREQEMPGEQETSWGLGAPGAPGAPEAPGPWASRPEVTAVAPPGAGPVPPGAEAPSAPAAVSVAAAAPSPEPTDVHEEPESDRAAAGGPALATVHRLRALPDLPTAAPGDASGGRGASREGSTTFSDGVPLPEEPGDPDGPEEDTWTPGPAAGRVAAAQAAARAAARGERAVAPARGAARFEEDVPSEDDEDAEEAGVVGLEVVKRLLGATVLEEITVTQEGR
ncbi:MAG: DNA polymerase III subunit gamma and tau [Actinomyces sp.]|uniref:DNA polymerase III subunit gamma and tau n=1 Tax=Actinomyces sp. TaxID=29317 RepID=UPI0026DB0E77|nr:DNA polymerase III subunit gamma and tau [Actinomyces sp.]MDO4244190.1 DNA polymerase III subunit gamma and tau [Actinomyces sp.]MDO4244193.1 DNA polymerase III subunit gamma and tau [Actinomyces sp.]